MHQYFDHIYLYLTIFIYIWANSAASQLVSPNYHDLTRLIHFDQIYHISIHNYLYLVILPLIGPHYIIYLPLLYYIYPYFILLPLLANIILTWSYLLLFHHIHPDLTYLSYYILIFGHISICPFLEIF